MLPVPVIAKPITHLINISINEGIFPDDFKMAKITPNYKKGEKSDPGNYRPLSILPTLSKIIEKHIEFPTSRFPSVIRFITKGTVRFQIASLMSNCPY